MLEGGKKKTEKVLKKIQQRKLKTCIICYTWGEKGTGKAQSGRQGPAKRVSTIKIVLHKGKDLYIASFFDSPDI